MATSWIADGLANIQLPLPAQASLPASKAGAGATEAAAAKTSPRKGAPSHKPSTRSEAKAASPQRATVGVAQTKKHSAASPAKGAASPAKGTATATTSSPAKPTSPVKARASAGAARASPSPSKAKLSATARTSPQSVSRASPPRLSATGAPKPKPAAKAAAAAAVPSVVPPPPPSAQEEAAVGRATTQEGAEGFAVGDKVVVAKSGHRGVVRFIGNVKFGEGTWIGVELELALGKNDGSVQGRKYFHCAPNHGILVRADALAKAPARPKHRQVTASAAAAAPAVPVPAAVAAPAPQTGA